MKSVRANLALMVWDSYSHVRDGREMVTIIKVVERKITIDGILKMVKSQKYQIPFTLSRVNIV